MRRSQCKSAPLHWFQRGDAKVYLRKSWLSKYSNSSPVVEYLLPAQRWQKMMFQVLPLRNAALQPFFSLSLISQHTDLHTTADLLKLQKLLPPQLKVGYHCALNAEGWLIGDSWMHSDTGVSQLSVRSFCCWIIIEGCWHLTAAAPTIQRHQQVKVDFGLRGRWGKSTRCPDMSAAADANPQKAESWALQ